MMEPIMITGAGIVSAIGANRAETLAALLNRQTGIAPLHYLKTAHREFPVGEVKMSDEDMKQRLGITQEPTTRTSLMGMLALQEALDSAALTGRRDLNVMLVSGTTVGGMDKSEQYYLDYLSNDDRNAYIRTHDCGATTELMAQHFGLFTMATSISTACSSAANAIILGANLIRSGRAEIVVVGGAECITKFHLNGFNSLMILDHEQCRPFDATRAGLNLGEGAAYLVLETAASARRRGVQPMATLSGYGNACDAFHQTASSDDGEGAYLAMQKALRLAGLQPEDIDYVNAHGTGTPNNDVSESQALFRLFADKLPPVSSTKGMTGHTTSASGSVEAVICLLALQHGFIPANYGWKEPMENGVVPVAQVQKGVALHHVMCNSFGFGGNDSSLILSTAASSKGRQQQPTPIIYIKAATQISAQQPLCEDWMTEPVLLSEPYVRSTDPDFKAWLSPLESRRMGKIMRRALVTAMKMMQDTGIPQPDAIVTGTGLGCIENTELFLDQLCREGEEMLKPTYFMQSTHNTISSLIAIKGGCHGYNTTYSHKGISFDSALLDAFLQLQLGDIRTALVTGNDEMTPSYFSILQRTGYVGAPGEVAATEASAAMMLTTEPGEALCSIEDVRLSLGMPQLATFAGSVDAIMLGYNGQADNDRVYEALAAQLPDVPQLHYKHLFGEGYTTSGLGLYASAQLLKRGQAPAFMRCDGGSEAIPVNRLLFVNHSDGQDVSCILLKRL